MEKSEEQKRFEKEVNDVINGQNNLNAIKICNTPMLLQEIGLEDKPILYSKSHLLKAISLYDKNKHHHGISIQDIYNLPNYIKEPTIILKNYKNKNEPILVLEAINSEKAPIIAIIDINGKGYYEYKEIESNFLLSLYGKENFDNYLSYANTNNEIIFYDKKRVQQLETLTTLSLCNCISNIEPNKILQQINEKVNSKIEKNDIKSEEKSMKNNNFYEELTDNQKEALKETKEQYKQTYYGQYKDDEISVNDLIDFYKKNMLDNDANSFRDKYMREIIEKEILQDKNTNIIEKDTEEESNIIAKINDLIEKLKEYNNKNEVYFDENSLGDFKSELKKEPNKLLDKIKDYVKECENEDINNKIDEIENDISKYIEKMDKEILNKYIDLLQNHYAKIDDNKFNEEMNKMTTEEKKELITKAYKNNNNVNTQEFINVMEYILSQDKVDYNDLKEKYDPSLYKVYDYNDGEELLYIGYDYEKAKNVAKQQVDDTDGECKVYIDKVDKNLIFHMEKLVEEYYKAGNIPLSELHNDLIKSFQGVYGESKYKDAGEFAFEWLYEYDKYRNGYSGYNYERLYHGNLIYDNLLEKYNYYTHNSKLGKEELEKALKDKTWSEMIKILQNKVAKFEIMENKINEVKILK